MAAYYNEIDPFAAEWLRNLIRAEHIAPGDVDERSIVDVHPDDLTGYTQCHFFAGIGVWSYALRKAGWHDDRPVWTGSPPCQPFSTAGERRGKADKRHLWPELFRLIRECRPPVFFGEQVAAAISHGWLDDVFADLEGAGYVCGAVGIPAAGVGAPHIRQRLWIVAQRLADTDCGEQQGVAVLRGNERNGPDARWPQGGRGAASCGAPSGLADANIEQHNGTGDVRTKWRDEHSDNRAACWLADTDGSGWVEGQWDDQATRHRDSSTTASIDDRHEHPGPTNGFWRDADWLFCRDGKWRAIEPGTFPLAHGAAARVGRLRAYGNAVVAPVAQAFIEAYLEWDRNRQAW